MASLDFFAAESDQRALLEFLFASTDVRIFESYSDLGEELRELRSVDEVAAAFPLGVDRSGNGTAVMLQLWSPSVMKELTITRLALNPEVCNGYTFRYTLEGGALIQLHLGGIHERVLTRSHFGHNSPIRARKWGVDAGASWDALKTLSNRIQYHLRKRLAVAKVPGCPVLPHAYDLARSGYALKATVRADKQYEIG